MLAALLFESLIIFPEKLDEKLGSIKIFRRMDT